MKKLLTVAVCAVTVLSLSGCKKCYDCYTESGGIRSATAEVCGKDEADTWEKNGTQNVGGVQVTATCNEQ